VTKLSWLTARIPDPEILPTPSFGLNRALNGGLYSGRIHVYWGQKASGKTTSALYQIAMAQREGKICGIVDAERAFNPEWAERCGVDVDALRYIDKNVAEELTELICPSLASGEIDLLVVDSLSSLGLKSYLDKPEQNAIGSYARASKFFTHKILNVLNHDQQIILISHAAIDISGQHPVIKPAIGNAIDHWASTIIKFQLRHGEKNLRDDGARKVSWRVDKSKTSKYPIEGEYYFNQDTASIDSLAEIASYCVDEGVVERGGSWIYYPTKDLCGDNKWQSEAKFVAGLREDEPLREQIVKELFAKGVKVAEDDEE
jgi:recombination protein RecA